MAFTSRNLVIPRGKVFFAQYLPGTMTPGSFKDLGNCPQFSLNVNFTKTKTYDSVGGRLVVSNEFKVMSGVSGTIITDDIGLTNLTLWLNGTHDPLDQNDVEIEFDSMEVEGELQFISYNPRGPQRTCVFPRVKLYPTGELDLIGDFDRFSTIGLEMSALLKPGRKSLFTFTHEVVRVSATPRSPAE